MNEYDINRRQFAKSAAAIATAFGLSNFDVPEILPTVHAGTEPVRFGFIVSRSVGGAVQRNLSQPAHHE